MEAKQESCLGKESKECMSAVLPSCSANVRAKFSLKESNTAQTCTLHQGLRYLHSGDRQERQEVGADEEQPEDEHEAGDAPAGRLEPRAAVHDEDHAVPNLQKPRKMSGGRVPQTTLLWRWQ